MDVKRQNHLGRKEGNWLFNAQSSRTVVGLSKRAVEIIYLFIYSLIHSFIIIYSIIIVLFLLVVFFVAKY